MTWDGDGMNRVRNRQSVKGLLHESRYRFAKSYAHGQRVLELGCGSGFGLGYGEDAIATVAEAAVGIDNCAPAIWWARENCRGQYKEADITAPLRLCPHFDLVIAFEVLEHLQGHDMLHAAAASMQAGAVFIMSTPNIERTHNTNHFHVKEYTRSELHALLSRHFESVVILGQQKLDGSDRLRKLYACDPLKLRRYVPKRLHDVVRKVCRIPLWDELDSRKHYPITGDTEGAYGFIAVCREPL